MRIPIYQVDAFTSKTFGGNPAAVCPLDSWLSDELLQAIAAENNLSETAFIVPQGEDYHLRWFTPALEVDLCGHATLAAAKVVFTKLRTETSEVVFHTRSGPLAVKRDDNKIEMDFPSQPGSPIDTPEGTVAGLAGGGTPLQVYRSVHYDLMVYETEEQIRAINPIPEALMLNPQLGVIATAPGSDVDFVSRLFAPRAGILEDPVTGSAHCVAAPYWAERLGKTTLTARQISHRVGELVCRLVGNRVVLVGEGVFYLEGFIEVGRGDEAALAVAQ